MSYKIHTDKDPKLGATPIDLEVERITVLLGANGTGKSSLIKRLCSLSGSFGSPTRPVIYVEGGRVVSAPSTLAIERDAFGRHQTRDLAQIRQAYESKRTQKLADRVRYALGLMDQIGEHQKAQHSDAVTRWEAAGEPGKVPHREEPPLERLFRLFAEVFPEISFDVQPPSKDIKCRKRGVTFAPQELSDGERQVLALLADLVILGDDRSLVLVDEPELNLNMNLACRLWDSVESFLPNAVFVYATHALGFAMRSSVQTIYVLSGSGKPPMKVQDVSQADPVEVREFLGAVPAIVASLGAVVVEGRDSSVDGPFFAWLLGRKDYVIVPVGGCENVTSAAKRTGVWERLAPSVRLAGIIDRDYRSDEVLNRIECDGCLILDFHEIESYLCQPDLFAEVAGDIGTVETPPTAEQVRARIITYLQDNAFRVAVRRASSRSDFRLGISIARAELNCICDEKELIRTLRTAAAAEQAKATASRIG
ncbi:MAG: ATP-binding cassette domain-containing protein [Acidobacteria bacterium]|nr:MAG: ATP-binding cassette domain-containing protein [Acidobacteriota bacterium]